MQVPNWWKAEKPPRPVVSVQVNAKDQKSRVGVDALLDFRVGVTLDGENAHRRRAARAADRHRRAGAAPRQVGGGRPREAGRRPGPVGRGAAGRLRAGLSFFEGMRLLSGRPARRRRRGAAVAIAPQWTGIAAGPSLEKTLAELRNPDEDDAPPPGLQGRPPPLPAGRRRLAPVRHAPGPGRVPGRRHGPGQDDPGPVAAAAREEAGRATPRRACSCCPASLIGNWRSEAERFAPDPGRRRRPPVGKACRRHRTPTRPT